MFRPRSSIGIIFLTIGTLVIAGCGADDSASTTTPQTPATTLAEATTSIQTTAAPPTTLTAIPETTTTPATAVPLSALDELLALGYTMSNEYVVETVIRDIDAGTGGLAVDSDGTIYQSDFGYPGHNGDSVLRVDPDGTTETFAMSDEMGSLTMTTFGADGQLYQSSYGTDRVFRIADDGTTEVVVEGISGPTGLVVLDDGTMFVEAYDRGIIHKVDPDGTVSDWSRHPEYAGVNGLTVGPDGTFYAVNHRDGGLFAVDSNGEITILHEFPRPTSHVAYLDGGLFVTSRGAYVVYRYDLESGAVAIIAGNAEPGDQDGRGAESSFGRPNAITAGPDGALYFNHGDGDTNQPVHIRRIVHQP